VNEKPPSRDELLAFAERVAEIHLAQIRQWRKDEARRRAERERGEVARPPDPDWVVERGVSEGRLPIRVHVGGCHMVQGMSRGVDQLQALRALSEGVPACGHCRPDAALHFLEG
jgi:hypothetical protein